MESRVSNTDVERIEEAVVTEADRVHRLSHSLEDVGDIDEFIEGLAGLIEQAAVLKHMRSKRICTPHLVHSSAEAI